jgi:RNA 2',3'-cyclic 3'-phosphodiesterase
MRLFIALELPQEIKAELAALQQALRQARAEVAWTKAENLHLTLKFLGEVPAERVEQIAQACRAAAQTCAPLLLTTQGTGFFPDARRPRVVWAGLSGAVPDLLALQRQLAERLVPLGFPREDKPFRPHLTLGRCKSPKNLAQLVARAEAYALPARSFTASELVLMQSQLHPTGSIYTPLQRAGLAASLAR